MKALSLSVRITSNTEMALNEIYLIMQNKQNPVAIVLILLLLLIALMIWLLISFGSYLFSLVISPF